MRSRVKIRFFQQRPPKVVFVQSLKSLFFLATVFFFTSCSVEQRSSSPKSIALSTEDRIWIEKFFGDFFLKEATIYTLFGSKPMSMISLCSASREEWVEEYADYIKGYSEEEKKGLYLELEEYLDQYDLPSNWEKWMAWSSEHLDGSYLFAKKPTEVKQLYILKTLQKLVLGDAKAVEICRSQPT